MTRKQLILDLWAHGLTPTQTADLLGCTDRHVRATLHDLGIRLHRFNSTNDAIAWLEVNAKTTAAHVAQFRNGIRDQAQQPATA